MQNETTTFSAIRLTVSNGIARIALTQGARGNPFDAPFCRQLHEVAANISARSDIRVIVFEAEGKAFSYGGDLKALTRDQAAFPAFADEALPQLGGAVALLRAHDAPLVAIVHGVAAGGGLGLVAACDFILAAQEARFVAAFSGIGMSADTGTSYFLPRRVGLTRASAFLMLNQSWSAAEALAHGLVSSVHASKDLPAAADALVAQLVAGPILAQGEIKRLLDGSHAATLAEQLGAETASIRRLCQTEDAWNAMNAVLEKRVPVFRGR